MNLRNVISPRQGLVQVASEFYRRGWMAGTAGNLSCRDPGEPACFWVTASGRAKGGLTVADFLLVDIGSGEVLDQVSPGNKPSAETVIHRALYRLDPRIQACLHVHSVDACLVGMRHQGDALPLPPLEMLKGLGIWEEHPTLELPVFENYLDVDRIGAEINRRFNAQVPQVPAFLIRHHGITVWGESLEQAFHRTEIMEFILSFLAREGGATRP